MSTLSVARRVPAPDAKRTFEDWLMACNSRPTLWLATCAALLAVQISPWWYSTPDTVVYLSTARSIGLQHTLATLGNPQLGFPPGYPLLLSPAFLLSARPFLIVSVIHWCLAVALMLGTYRWARRACPQTALLLTGVVMVHVSVWIHYRRALSELAFMTLLIWTVQSLDAVRAARSLRAVLARALPASVLVLLLSMIREVGIVVAVGFSLASVLDVRRGRVRWPVAVVRMLAVLVPTAAAIAAFVRYEAAMKVASATPLGTHLDGLMSSTTTFVERLMEGVRLRVSEVGRLLIPGMFNAYGRPGDWGDLNVLVYVPVCVVVAVGWWRYVRRRDDVLALTMPVYVAAYILWPFEAGTRYLLPMLPGLLACVWWMIEPLRRQRLTILAVLLIGHLGVATGHWIIKEMPQARMCHAQWGSVERLVTAIGSNARGAVSADVPQCVQLMLAFSLDRAVAVARSPDAERDVEWLVTTQAEPAAGFSVSLRAAPYTLLARDADQ